MKQLLEELTGIPEAAERCLKEHKNLRLPTAVPYIGMGASACVSLTLYHSGVNIQPHMASEYFLYPPYGKPSQKAVLISQSGETTETLWCTKKFKHIIAVTNNKNSSLAKGADVVVPMYAGTEEYLSATKTYVNTLIGLYVGLGHDPSSTIRLMRKNFFTLQAEGEEVADKIFTYVKKRFMRGFFVVGSGPNLATALDCALVLSETTKYLWQGTELGQFDHGYKEAANDSVVLLLDASGPDSSRMKNLEQVLVRKSNACVIRFRVARVPIVFSPLLFLPKMYFCMNRLADLMKVERQEGIGGKITRVV